MAYNPINQRFVSNLTASDNNIEIVIMKDIPVYDIDDYTLTDEKELKIFYKDIEKMVRSSIEYTMFIQYIKNYMDMNQCSFLQGVSNIGAKHIKIHIHHSPITLEEIAIIVHKKREFYMESLEVEQCAKEITYLHYLLIIGLIPLSETLHELVHNGYLFIPNDKVFGRYHTFLEKYDQWIPKEMKDKFDNIEQYTLTYNKDQNNKVLELNYVYINMEDDSSALPTMESIQNLVKQRMNYNRLLSNSNTTDINLDTEKSHKQED